MAKEKLRKIAGKLYESVKSLPIVSPHGHVDPSLFADKNAAFGDPVELLVIPDHYLSRMLYSQGIPLENLGIPRIDAGTTEKDHRKIWQIVAENFYLFRGTPTGIWLAHELAEVFGIREKLSSETGMAIYDEINEKLKKPEYSPRTLFEKFNIEVLCTTDPATDTLKYHRLIKDSGWKGDIRPSFRPDSVVNNIGTTEWRKDIELLGKVSGVDIRGYNSYIKAIKKTREYFKSMGATSTDSAPLTPYTEELPQGEAEKIFQNGLNGIFSPEDRKSSRKKDGSKD